MSEERIAKTKRQKTDDKKSLTNGLTSTIFDWFFRVISVYEHYLKFDATIGYEI
jgi:hypothetical protein